MAIYSGMGLDLPFSASGDLGDYQYHFVKCASGKMRVDAATGASNPVPIGVLQNDPHSEGAAIVRVAGVTKVCVSSSTAISVGQLLMCGSLAKAEIVNDGASGYSGISLEDIPAGVSTGYVSMLLRPMVTKLRGTS